MTSRSTATVSSAEFPSMAPSVFHQTGSGSGVSPDLDGCGVCGPAFDPGSFRDRDGRVFVQGGGVFRLISKEALLDWRALRETNCFRRSVERGELIATSEAEGLAEEVIGGAWAGVLQHAKVSFISYPNDHSYG